MYLDFATLSHVWGSGTVNIKITSANLPAMRQNIDWLSLPRTIQDAVVMTRKLGIRYLWLDSLCILQAKGENDADHAADWRREAARFGGYYENSVVTIAETGAVDASEGLFLNRPGLVFEAQPHSVDRISHSASLTPITIYPQTPTWSSEIKGAPLSQRGWAAQERLLSRRILHFARNCVLWECHTLLATEMNPSGLARNDKPQNRLGADLE